MAHANKKPSPAQVRQFFNENSFFPAKHYGPGGLCYEDLKTFVANTKKRIIFLIYSGIDLSLTLASSESKQCPTVCYIINESLCFNFRLKSAFSKKTNGEIFDILRPLQPFQICHNLWQPYTQAEVTEEVESPPSCPDSPLQSVYDCTDNLNVSQECETSNNNTLPDNVSETSSDSGKIITPYFSVKNNFFKMIETNVTKYQ